MCEFVSWIEKDGKNYFLTSADLASKRGIELREHCGDDDDLVGHGALRWFYGGFEGGVQRECTDFSTPLNFPAEIVEAIKAGKFRGMGCPVGLLNDAAWAECVKIVDPARAERDKIVNAAWAEFDKIVDPARAEFDKVVDPARAEYDKVRYAARAEFDKIVNAARAERDKIVDPARAEFDKIVDPARAEYDKVRYAARAEYNKIVDKTFWDLFMIIENRNPAWV